MIRYYRTLIRNERGQGLTEYALLIALVSIAAVAAMTLFGSTIVNNFYTVVTDTIANL